MWTTKLFLRQRETCLVFHKLLFFIFIIDNLHDSGFLAIDNFLITVIIIIIIIIIILKLTIAIESQFDLSLFSAKTRVVFSQ